MIKRNARVFGMIVAATLLTGPVFADPRGLTASTRLRHCGKETCLLITGHRPDPTAAIVVARHDVAVEGGRHWRVAVPLRTVQEWSAPSARSISVEVAGGDGGEVLAPLPIGVLGHVTQLAFLDVSARH